MRIDQMHFNFELELDRVSSNDRPDFMPWEIDEYLNKAIWKFIKERYSVSNKLKVGFETNQKRIDELSTLHIKSPELQPAINATSIGNGRYEVSLANLGDNINGQYFRYLFLTAGNITIKKDDCTKKVRHKSWQIDDIKTSFTQPSWKWGRVLASFGKSSFTIASSANPNISDEKYKTDDLVLNEGLSTEIYNNIELSSIYFDTTDYNGVSQFEVVDACLSYIKYPNRVFLGGYNHIDKHSTISTDPIHCDLPDAFHDEIINIAVYLAQIDIQDQFGVQVSNKKIIENKQL